MYSGLNWRKVPLKLASFTSIKNLYSCNKPSTLFFINSKVVIVVKIKVESCIDKENTK